MENWNGEKDCYKKDCILTSTILYVTIKYIQNYFDIPKIFRHNTKDRMIGHTNVHTSPGCAGRSGGTFRHKMPRGMTGADTSF